MENVHLNCGLQIMPLNDGEAPDGAKIVDTGGNRAENTFDPYLKELVFTDMDTGKIIHYKVSGDLCKILKQQLGMNNRAHVAKLQQTARDAQPRR